MRVRSPKAVAISWAKSSGGPPHAAGLDSEGNKGFDPMPGKDRVIDAPQAKGVSVDTRNGSGTRGLSVNMRDGSS